jgi:RNA polymerase sigma factor (sigma-70 family)
VAIDVDAAYRRYGPMVLRRCRYLLRDEEKAVDAMQDVFVQLIRHRELTSDALSSLLHRMATNVCLNRMRGDGRRPADRDEEVLLKIAALDDMEERTTAGAVLARLFGREPESTRTIAVLHLVDGMTLEETAAEVGMSVSGIRKRLRTLRAHLQELEGAELGGV